MIKVKVKYEKYVDSPSILGLNSIRNELDWAHKAPKTAGDDFIKVGHGQNRRARAKCACAPLNAKQHISNFILFRSPGC